MRFAILLCALAIASTTAAQNFSQMSSLSDLQKKASKSTLQLPEQPAIERAVDDEEYLVGPGDVLSIVIGGQADDVQQSMISPEGKLLLPAIGPVDLSGKTLKEAKAVLYDRLEEKYLAKDIAISLIQVRSFRVAISGAVNYPGMVPVNGMNRVSDAILMAGGLVEPPPPFPKPKNPQKRKRTGVEDISTVEISARDYQALEEQVASKRNIFIKRMDGSTIPVDLLKFERAGDLDANPFLADGDVVIVPTEQTKIGEISIFGALRSPGTFEYAKGDRVRDLFKLAHGFTIDADSSRIELVRFVDNSSKVETKEYELDWHNTAGLAAVLDMPLHPDDRIFVRSMPKYHRKRTVEISGEVVYPGEYPLMPGSTHLSDVVEKAGGFTDEAALNAAYVVRRSFQDRKDPDFDRLDYMTGMEMERKERAYYRERAREIKGLVSTDFVRLFEKGEKSYDVKLSDDDLIVVPGKEYSVNVVGHVKNPGLVPFVENKKASYYIDKTGGLNVGAWKSKIRVKKAGTGEMLSAKNTVVEMGDMVFIPEKIDRDNLARDVALIAAQMATVILVGFQAYAVTNDNK